MNFKKEQIRIGKMIKKSRLSQGISYYRITKETGVRWDQIKAIEEGNTNYTNGSLIAIEKVIKSGVINENIFADIEPVTD